MLAESPRALRPTARSLADVHDIPGRPTCPMGAELAARPAAFPTGSPRAVQGAPSPVCGMRLWRVRGKQAFATSSRSVRGGSVRWFTIPLAYYRVGRRLGGRPETRSRSLRSPCRPRRPRKRGASSSSRATVDLGQCHCHLEEEHSHTFSRRVYTCGMSVPTSLPIVPVVQKAQGRAVSSRARDLRALNKVPALSNSRRL